MGDLADDGRGYQAGTLAGNRVAMAAGLAALKQLLLTGFYEALEEKTNRFTGAIETHCREKGYPVRFPHIGSIFWVSFSESSIRSAEEIDPKRMDYFKALHQTLLNRQIYLGPSGYEVGFVSAAHTEADLESAARAFCGALDEVFMVD